MAISEREIRACAVEEIRQHGEDAAIQAAIRADELLEIGELDGAATWQRIISQINLLDAGSAGLLH